MIDFFPRFNINVHPVNPGNLCKCDKKVLQSTLWSTHYSTAAAGQRKFKRSFRHYKMRDDFRLIRRTFAQTR